MVIRAKLIINVETTEMLQAADEHFGDAFWES